MSDSYVQLPTDGAGKKLDTEQLTVNSETVQRERDQLAGVGDDDIAVVTDTDPSGTEHGLAVRPVNVVNPITDAKSSASLAAGSSVDLDSTNVSSGATGKLMRVVCSSTVACKWAIKTHDGASETSIGVVFSKAFDKAVWDVPDKRFDTIAYASGDEGFRISVTNLDNENAADVYATIYWDEVS